ncbi:MAG: hypothetical protein K5873_11830, partial [Treponema sp.]|nr:hypothetical protein [Treponema sp.]
MKKSIFILAALFTSVAFAAPSSIQIKTSEKPVTNGWGDMGKLSYAKNNVIVIDDAKYSNPQAKREAFTNAIASGSVKSDGLNDKETLIILSGTVDLSDGKVSDKDHSYFDEFDPKTHQRLHKD